MAAKAGNTYIWETVTDSIEIRTVWVFNRSELSSKKLFEGD